MCSRCTELQARVDELENILWPESRSSARALKLQKRLQLSPTQAAIVEILYAAREGTSARELDSALPVSVVNYPISNRKDPEFRSIGTMRQFLHQIRRKLGADALQGNRWVGISLTTRGRALVQGALA